jgi:hypothetical protein
MKAILVDFFVKKYERQGFDALAAKVTQKHANIMARINELQGVPCKQDGPADGDGKPAAAGSKLSGLANGDGEPAAAEPALASRQRAEQVNLSGSKEGGQSTLGRHRQGEGPKAKPAYQQSFAGAAKEGSMHGVMSSRTVYTLGFVLFLAASEAMSLP